MSSTSTKVLCLLLPLLCASATTSSSRTSTTKTTTAKTTPKTTTAKTTTTARTTSVKTTTTSSILPSTTSPVPSSTSAAVVSSTTAPMSSSSLTSSLAVSSSVALSSTVVVSSSFSSSTTVDVSSSSTSTSSAAVTSSADLTSSSSSVLASSSSTSSAPVASSSVVVSGDVGATILVIARDDYGASTATRGLNGYGIPYETLIVPSAGIALPALNSSGTANYGGIVVVGGVVYDYGASGYLSALTTDQWAQLYAYQVAYSVRMVQFGIFPNTDHGVTALGGCCGSGVEQLISFTNTTSFAQAGLKANAGMSTSGLYHYPATISDPATTYEIAQFAPSSDGSFATAASAGVVNNFSGREQMVFFLDFATDWSATSSFLQHAYITWMTRGLYAGFRRTHLGTQIDDVMLATDIYYPAGNTYRTTPDDMTGIANWIPTINAKMPPGSSYTVELGYNGNGNFIASEVTATGETACAPGSIEYAEVPETALEFKKPLGTGVDFWPATPKTYTYSSACYPLDPLTVWVSTASNRDKFMHISHTFTHEEMNNATYADALKEIQFNQEWLSRVGISSGRFTANGLIPPAITGLHNGDALRAWHDAGLTNCVGDNTRPVLKNSQNDMWPLITNEADNGFAGFQITPRFASRIYYNCDTGECTTQEWIVTSAGAGTFNDLLAVEKQEVTRHLMGLYHDPYMFHQANLRNTGNINPTTINGVSAKISIMQAWVETVVQEYTRLVNWPIITLGQADFAASFAARMARDQCKYKMTNQVVAGKITGVTITATNNQCSSPIPVTVPGSVTNTQGFKTEQIGNDPLTIWVTLSGSPVSLTLSSPISLL